MKELNKDKKITDKAFSRLVILSVAAILMCIIALTSSTWALFSEVTPNSNNAIKAADNCLLEVKVYDNDDPNGVEISSCDVDTPSEISIEPGKTYVVSLSLPKESSSGYLEISYSGLSNNTDYILRHKDDEPHTLEFTITLSEDISSPVKVTFTPHWGTHSVDPSIHDGDLLEITE